MPYELTRRDAAALEVQRVALEQVDRIAGEASRYPTAPESSVHEMRRRIKELRALLRLTRAAIGDEAYAVENILFRDLARTVSGSRDTDAALQLLRRIRSELTDAAGKEAYRSLRRALRRRGVQRRLESLAIDAELQSARERISGWQFNGNDGFGVIKRGLSRTYRRGADALRRALESHAAEDLHELRKHVKDQMYHLQLLRDVAPTLLKPHRELLTQLGKTLGEHHDLHTIDAAVERVPFRTAGRREAIRVALQQRMQLRENEALSLARVVYAESPRAWLERMSVYWNATV